MQDRQLPTRPGLVGAVAASVLALAVAGLGVYAIFQGIVEKRPIYIVEGAVPLFFSFWVLRVFTGFWTDWIRNRPCTHPVSHADKRRADG